MRVLFVTNMWPVEQRPWYGTFVRTQAESLERLGVSLEVMPIVAYERRHGLEQRRIGAGACFSAQISVRLLQTLAARFSSRSRRACIARRRRDVQWPLILSTGGPMLDRRRWRLRRGFPTLLRRDIAATTESNDQPGNPHRRSFLRRAGVAALGGTAALPMLRVGT